MASRVEGMFEKYVITAAITSLSPLRHVAVMLTSQLVYPTLAFRLSAKMFGIDKDMLGINHAKV
jgi:hypothetical protein